MENVNNSGYADLAFGFIGGINDIGPLIPAIMPDLKLSARVIIEDSGREARIDLTARPPMVEISENTRAADITVRGNSRDFHNILRGKLGIMKAWNEKKLLLELVPSALGTMSLPASEGKDPVAVPGFIYEMYLTSIGADKMLEDNSPTSVALTPHKKGMFQVFIVAIAWMVGLLAGFGIRIFRRHMEKAAASDKIPNIKWSPITEVPKPGKPFELGKISSGILRWFFARVDLFRMAKSFTSGALITAGRRS